MQDLPTPLYSLTRPSERRSFAVTLAVGNETNALVSGQGNGAGRERAPLAGTRAASGSARTVPLTLLNFLDLAF